MAEKETRPEETRREEVRDYISLSRPRGYLGAPSRRYRRTWRLWTAALCFGVAYLSLQGLLPVPETWRERAAFYLTSPAADWTPRLARYLGLDSFDRYGYFLGGGPDLEAGQPGASELPALAPAEAGAGTEAGAAPVPGGSEPPLPALTVPVEGEVLRPFGWSASPVGTQKVFHPGVDLAVRPGQSVRAALAGTVKTVDVLPVGASTAYAVRIAHEGGLETVYERLAEVRVTPGQPVAAGEEIGTAVGRWLHFGLERSGRPLDPGLDLVH
ncbi:MAG: murein hydrolase activator EnvC family protein [Moorellales bacterium]